MSSARRAFEQEDTQAPALRLAMARVESGLLRQLAAYERH